MTTTIRPCRPDDAQTLVTLIRELAVYEHLEEFAKATPEALRAHLFGPRPFAEAIIAEVDGTPVGFALYFSTFSTFRAQAGLYLEDIFVRESYRGRGIGKGLLATVAKVAFDRGCGRLEWSVLDWNAPSIGFYRSLGARPLDEWTVYRIDDEPLARLAALAPSNLEKTAE
jgi:GNAT superfamily N-acetyltransferase